MTTLDVIKQLPIDEKLKSQILNLYDYMEPAQKLSIQRIAWKTYDLMRAQRIDAGIEHGFEDVKNDKRNLGKDFYARVVSTVDQAMAKDAQESIGVSDLAAARRAMEQIMHEIRSAKKTP